MRHHHSIHSLGAAHRATAVLTEGHDTISPRALGTVERLVGAFQHLVRRALLEAFGHANADRHRDHRGAGTGAPLATLLIVLGATVLIAQVHLVAGNRLTDFLQVRQAFFERTRREHQSKLFPAITIGTAAATNFRQLAGHQAQDLVTDVVAVGVVEFLEVIDVAHGQYIVTAQALQTFIQRPPSGQAGQLIAKRHLTQSHLDFLPESHTDFIIAVLGEEFGLVGICLLLIVYLLLIGRGLMITAQAQTLFGKLLAGSLTMTFFVYVFVNIGMVSGLLPVVGVPLPFISYGGTSLVTLLSAFGVLMSIHTHRKWIAQV